MTDSTVSETTQPITCNLDRKGTVCIRPGGKHQEPAAVMAGGINGFDMQVLHELNSDTMTMCDPESNTLLDFDYKKLELLRLEWKVENADRIKERAESHLAEFLERQAG